MVIGKQNGQVRYGQGKAKFKENLNSAKPSEGTLYSMYVDKILDYYVGNLKSS